MAEGFALKAEVRERTGKGAARALRREGKIPAVIYGNNQPPLPIAVPHKEMTLALYGGGFLTNVWSIDVDGRTEQALARDYQREPVKDRLVHIDFLRVTARSRVTVDVPLVLVGEEDSPGVRDGGVATLVEFTVSVEAAATAIPDSIEVSLAGLDVGATITSADLTLPGDATLAAQTDEPFPVATITPPVGEVEDEAPEEAPEVEVGEADGEGAEGEGDGGESAGDDDGSS